MQLHLALVICVWATGVFAQSLPPALQSLQHNLIAQEAVIHSLKTEIEKHEKTSASSSRAWRHSSMALVQLARTPQNLMLVHGVVAGKPKQAGAARVLQAARHLHMAKLANTHAKLATLAPLYTQSQQHTLHLQNLVQSLNKQRGRLSLQQTVALNQAALTSAQLAQTLTTTLNIAPEKQTPAPQQPVLPPASHMPVEGKIIKGFNPQSGHVGWLFSAENGAKVSSITAGVVEYSGPFRHYGGMVIISAAPQKYIVYTGLARLLVNVGQQVQAGQNIGAMQGKKPRLYIEYRRRGVPVSPQQLYE